MAQHVLGRNGGYYFCQQAKWGLAQHIRDAGKRAKAGQTVRLVDIPADAGQGLGLFDTLHGLPSGAALSAILIKSTAEYYGTAAQAFLEKLTEPTCFAELPTIIKTQRQQFIEKNLPPSAGGQVHRVCERFALIAAAGELATQYGITGWQSGEANKAATRCFQAWLDYRGGTENQERLAILSQIRRFFEMHGESRFSDWETKNSNTLYRAGFRKTTMLGLSYYVLPEVFREELCAGFDYHTVTQLLLTEG